VRIGVPQKSSSFWQTIPPPLAGIIHVGRNEVANPCRSCANLQAFKNTLRTENRSNMRPKFRQQPGLLDTAYMVMNNPG